MTKEKFNTAEELIYDFMFDTESRILRSLCSKFRETPEHNHFKIDQKKKEKYRKKTEEKYEGFYEVLDKIDNWATGEVKNETMKWYFRNRVVCLGALLPYLIDYAKEEEIEAGHEDRRASAKFFNKAIKGELPYDVLPILSVIWTYENEKYKIKKLEDEEHYERGRAWLDKMRNIYQKYMDKLFDNLEDIEKEEEEERKKDPEILDVEDGDIITYEEDFEDFERGDTSPISLFENGEPKRILLFGKTGAGKTFATLRFIQEAIKKDFTVVVLAPERRKEFYYGHFPIIPSPGGKVKTLYQKVKGMGTVTYQQNEEPLGLPITIYTQNPKYRIEKDIESFGGTKEDWENLEGVNVFDSDHLRVVEKFMDWRSEHGAKKMVFILNEAQEVASSYEAEGKEWKVAKKMKKLFYHLRGYNCPAILNSFYPRLLKKSTLMYDEIFVSTMKVPGPRKSIVELFGVKGLGDEIKKEKYHDNNIFFRRMGDQAVKVKFLIPTCCPRINEEGFEVPDMFEKKKIKNKVYGN